MPLTNFAWSPSLCSNHTLHRCTLYTYHNRKSPQVLISINVITNHRIVSTFHHSQGVSAGTKEMYHDQLQLRFQFIYLSHYNMSISVPLRLIGLSGTGLDQFGISEMHPWTISVLCKIDTLSRWYIYQGWEGLWDQRGFWSFSLGRLLFRPASNGYRGLSSVLDRVLRILIRCSRLRCQRGSTHKSGWTHQRARKCMVLSFHGSLLWIP